MEGKGKRKRSAADEAENSLGPGREQPLEEEKTAKNIDTKDKRYHRRVKYESNKYKEFCERPEFIHPFKTFLEEEMRRIEETLEFKLGKKVDICGEHKLTEKLAAKYEKRIRQSSENEGRDKLSDEDALDCLLDLQMWAGYLAARREKEPAVRPGMGPKVDPVSPGFDCKTRPPQESCNTEVISMVREMQQKLQQMQDNMDTKIQHAVVAALQQSGFCQQKNAPSVCPAEPQSNHLGNQGGTNAAAGSSGGRATQSSPHNEENVGTNGNLYEDIFNLSVLDSEAQRGYLQDVLRDPCSFLQPSTTQTMPSTVGALNSTATGAMGTSVEQAEELKRKREEELDGNHRGQRPAAADNTPSCLPIGGCMAEACQNYCQSAAALATQGSPSSTNEGTQTQMTGAAHDNEASTSSWATLQKTFTYDQLGQGSIEEPSSYKEDAFPDVDISDFFPDWFHGISSDLGKCTGTSVGSSNVASNCEGELQSSTMILTAGAMNSPCTRGESIAAAGSSSGPITQSSSHNEKF